ncbi:hypothetical protein D3C85_1081990 [compost metagenome]
MTNLVVLTDPARELAELCAALQVETNKTGETFLAGRFAVDPWSREFFEIIFTITERCGTLQDIVRDLEIDDDFRDEMVGHVNAIMAAFSAQAMRAQWKDVGNKHLSPINVGPLKALSASVRQRVAYRKLDTAELAEILEETGNLLDWLREHQLEEQDFIRQAMIEGLERFQFRLERLAWLGWGYTLDSLREIIAAYMLLEREGIDPQDNPNAAAVLKKVGSVIQSVYERVATAKGVVETGDWLLKAYGAGSLVYQTGRPLIAGLLT